MKSKRDRSKTGKEPLEVPTLPQTTTGETPDSKSEEKSSDEAGPTQPQLLLVAAEPQPVEETTSSDDATNQTYHSLVDGDILSNYKEARSPTAKAGLKKARSMAKFNLDLERQTSLNGGPRERFESFNVPQSA